MRGRGKKETEAGSYSGWMLATEAGIGTTYAAAGQAITNRENGVREEGKSYQGEQRQG